FALMGLRQLYFLLGDLIDRLVYLKYGIAFILGFIGVKLFLHALNHNEVPFINGGQGVEWAPEISTWTSLGVIVAAMVVAVVASIIKTKADARKQQSLDGKRPRTVANIGRLRRRAEFSPRRAVLDAVSPMLATAAGLAGGVEPRGGEALRCLQRGDLLLARIREDGGHGVADRGDTGVDGGQVGVLFARQREVDHTAAVDHEVRRPQDAALVQLGGPVMLGEDRKSVV